MRTDDPAFLEELAGTTHGDHLVASVWRGGTPPVQVQVTGWSLDWDATRQVQGQATLTIADPDGDMAPWGYGDILAPGGSLMRLAWVSGATGLRLPLGVWRIRAARPSEQWRVYTRGSSITRVPGGGSVQVRADELTAQVVRERLDAVPGPVKSTCLAEVAHLLDGITALTSTVSDAPVPALTYGESRMDAIEQVLAVLGAVHRMAPDGSFEVLTPDPAPVATLVGGDGGTLVNVDRELTDDDVHNAVTSRGQSAAGSPLVARAMRDGGPLAYGGPFGRVTLFHSSTATTRDAVLADARAVLADEARGPLVVLPVECLTNAALQPHDTVTVAAPAAAQDVPLDGRVVTMRIASAGTGDAVTPAKRMQLGVAVHPETLEAAASRVRRGRFG